jgi:hypothetical protein
MESGFRFVVEEFYSVPTRGIVVTGRVEQGGISVGGEIGFLGTDGRWITALVAAIEVNRTLVENTEAGNRASLLLQGIKKEQIIKGTIFTEVPAAAPLSAPSRTSPPLPPSPRPPDYGEPIHPASSQGRTLLFIFIGILIVLALLYLQGK